jgi:hypothetical protein
MSIMDWLEPKEPVALMVPLITMAALSPAGNFPLRYADCIRARAACTEATGREASVPALESFPPAETYQAGCGLAPGFDGGGFGRLGFGPGFGGFTTGFSFSPGTRGPLHPVIQNTEKTAVKTTKKNREKLRTMYILKTCVMQFFRRKPANQRFGKTAAFKVAGQAEPVYKKLKLWESRLVLIYSKNRETANAEIIISPYAEE